MILVYVQYAQEQWCCLLSSKATASIFARVTRGSAPASSVAAAANWGLIILQWPHQGAKNSTRTGSAEPINSLKFPLEPWTTTDDAESSFDPLAKTLEPVKKVKIDKSLVGCMSVGG